MQSSESSELPAASSGSSTSSHPTINPIPTTTPIMSGQRQPIYLRCEMKTAEHRAALTPTTAKKLIDAGFDVTVERDPQRIFDDEEYEQ